MSENFVVPESERTRALYQNAKSPTELYELAMKELHERLGTSESPVSEPSRPSVQSTPASERPAQMRGVPFYRVMYGGGDGNSRAEITASTEEEFHKQIEDFQKRGWV